MSTTLQLRGYVPRTSLITGIDAAGRRITPTSALNDVAGDYGRSLAARMRLRNTGANALRVFWTVEDFNAEANYVSLAMGEVFSEPLEVGDFWVRSPAGTSLELTVFHRRG